MKNHFMFFVKLLFSFFCIHSAMAQAPGCDQNVTRFSCFESSGTFVEVRNSANFTVYQNVINSYANGDPFVFELSLADGCYTVEGTGDFNNAFYIILEGVDPNGTAFYSDNSSGPSPFSFSVGGKGGCADPSAVNYMPGACLSNISPCVYGTVGRSFVTVEICDGNNGIDNDAKYTFVRDCGGTYSDYGQSANDGSHVINQHVMLDGVYTLHFEDDGNPYSFTYLVRVDGVQVAIGSSRADKEIIVGDAGALIISGCTDPNAGNYNPNATCDDGSCATCCPNWVEVLWYVDNDENGIDDPLTWVFYNTTTNKGYTNSEFAVESTYSSVCLPPGDYIFHYADASGQYNGEWDLNIDGESYYGISPGQEVSFTIYGESTLEGCTDNSACNYNPCANTDDGSCSYEGCIVKGCTDPNANNFNPNADENDGSCDYISCCTGWTEIEAFFPDDGDAVNDFIGFDLISISSDYYAYTDGIGFDADYVLLGVCAPPHYQNITNDFSLVFTNRPGSNYTGTIELTIPGYPLMYITEGETVYFTINGAPVPGCSDPTACNYDICATSYDGSCVYIGCEVFGCTNATACNYNSNANTDNGSCEFVSCAVNGCTNPIACNFNPLATQNDGSCILRNTYYSDADNDGFGISTLFLETCNSIAPGYALVAGDCDDNNAAVNPNAAEILCNGVDDNCNGTIDEGSISGCTNSAACNYNSAANCDNGSCTFAIIWYLNADGDNYYSTTQSACSSPGASWTSTLPAGGAGDCNDNNAAIYPGATENKCNGIDDNCNGTIDEGRINGCTNATACNYNPAATCDNGSCTFAIVWYLNADNDNYYSTTQSACTSPGASWTSTLPVGGSGDCNDNNAAIHPGATENVCNGIDDNCNGTIDEGRINGCTEALACNYNPNATCDNGICTYAIVWYLDADNDTYYSSIQNNCSSPGSGWTNITPNGGVGDCNDGNATIHPGVTETCNNIDDDCDGLIDEGFDIDGDGFTSCNGDCNDNNSSIYPGAPELCNNIDDNCDGSIDEGSDNDLDQDGYTACAGDCNDNNPSVNPGATEIPCNNTDDDCDGSIDEGSVPGCTNNLACNYNAAATCNDGSCTYGSTWYLNADGDNYYTSSLEACSSPGAGWANVAPSGGSGDCNDNVASVYPGAAEICGNNTDDDCDGLIDESCCATPAAPTAIDGPAGACRNQIGIVFSTSPVAGAVSYIWTLPAGVSGTSSTNSITLSFSNSFSGGNICVKAVNGCGTIGAQMCRPIVIYLNVPQLPGSINGGTAGACAGNSVTYSIAPVNNAASYFWTSPANSSIIAGQGTTSITVVYNSNYVPTGFVRVQATNCKGNSPFRSMIVYGTPATPGLITGPTVAVCGGSTQTYSIVAVSGATDYNWAAPAGAVINFGQGTTSINVTFPSDFTLGILSVNASSVCGTSNTRSITMRSIVDTPWGIVGQATNLCGEGIYTYSVSPTTSALTYNWTAPEGCNIITNNGTSITLSIPDGFVSGNLSYTVTNACGTSSPRTLLLRSRPATPVSITGPASVCANSNGLIFSTAQVSSFTYAWIVPAGCVITNGQGTNSITVNWGSAAGVVYVKANNACGSSSNRSFAVSIMSCQAQAPSPESENSFGHDEVLRIEAFPNPNNGVFIVRSKFAGLFILQNELGQTLRKFTLDEYNFFQTEISGLSTGLYFISAEHEGKVVHEKILVTN
jgi:hypothetical protein